MIVYRLATTLLRRRVLKVILILFQRQRRTVESIVVLMEFPYTTRWGNLPRSDRLLGLELVSPLSIVGFECHFAVMAGLIRHDGNSCRLAVSCGVLTCGDNLPILFC